MTSQKKSLPCRWLGLLDYNNHKILWTLALKFFKNITDHKHLIKMAAQCFTCFQI